MKKKKGLVISLAAVMAIAMIGCGAAQTEATDSETTESVSINEENFPENSSADDIEMNISSDILGLADTGNKTSLKQDLIYTEGPGDINLYYYDDEGNRVIYDDEEEITVALDPVEYSGSAVFDLGDSADDSLIDSTTATVKLLDGNSYYADEFLLAADSLDGSWKNGQYVYALSEGDLEWNTWDYDTSADYNSSREWSIMGGDGSGVYNFIFEVSGIKYDGVELPAETFPVVVYIYGRTCTDLSITAEFIPNTYDTDFVSGLVPSDEVQWNWYTDNSDSISNKEPYMNDTSSDYFSVVWPEGSDASDITADNVTITLKSAFGDEYVLSTETAYGEEEYAVISGKEETQIIVTYQQWSFVPVYSTMEITVEKGELSASQSYDISSVAAYMVQTGGGGVTIDHTLTTYNYYGVSGMTLENAANTEYTLSTEIDGTVYYYAIDENGNPYLSEGVTLQGQYGSSTQAPDDAWIGDATEKYGIAVINNVVFAQTRLDNTQEIEVNGTMYTFKENVSATRGIADMLADGATLNAGFNMQQTAASKWAWTMRYQSGWTTLSAEPTTIPYVNAGEAYGFGFEPGSSSEIYTTLYEEATASQGDVSMGGPSEEISDGE